MKIVAGIVLYNPSLKRLKENINAVKSQVDFILFFDNASKNINDIIKIIKKNVSNYKIIKSEVNKGIAYALNAIAIKAIKSGYIWLLTLDQDTVIKSDLIENYTKYLNLPNLGQISCSYIDRNSKHIFDNLAPDIKVKKVKKCITSGTLLNLKAYQKVEGFDNELFIDYVDIEMCYALRKKGFLTYRINKIGMIHELGHSEVHYLFRHRITIQNEPAFRYFFIARNQIITARRYPNEENLKYSFLFQLTCIFKIIFFEKQKLVKIKEIMKGIRKGLTSNIFRKKVYYKKSF